jgi:RNA polymerase sigma factor FliA
MTDCKSSPATPTLKWNIREFETSGADTPMTCSASTLEGINDANYVRRNISFTEHSTTQRMSSDDVAGTQQILLEHLPQVRLVARSLWGRTRFQVDLDDLIGYGMLGLLDAVRKFDPSRGFLLKTYAEHRIRGAILDGLRAMDWLSRSARRAARDLDAGQATDLGPKGQQPKIASSQMLMASSDARQKILPLGTSRFSEEQSVRCEWSRMRSRQPDEVQSHLADQQTMVEQKQQRTALAQAIANLPDRQKNVLELYYQRELSMRQIGALLGVHESRVSQIHLAAIARLRKSLSPAKRVRSTSGRHSLIAYRAAHCAPAAMAV